MISRGWTGEQLLSLDESSYFDPDLKHAWKPPFAIILNLLQTLAETTGGLRCLFISSLIPTTISGEQMST